MSEDASLLWAEVAVFSALEKTLHYLVPEELAPLTAVGARVLVPLGRRQSTGLVLHVSSDPPPIPKDVKARFIHSLLDPSPVVPRELIELCRWISSYYFYPLGEVLQASLPSGLTNPPEPFFRLLSSHHVHGLSGVSRELLDSIGRKRGAGFKALQRQFPSLKNLRTHLNRLEAEGFIERVHVHEDSLPAPKILKSVRLLRRPENIPSRSKNLLQLLEFLEGQEGGSLVSDLRRSVSNADYWIRKLKDEGCLEMVTREVPRETCETDCSQALCQEKDLELTGEQAEALNLLLPAMDSGEFKPFVLFGVTGSGKTEVYLRLAEHALKAGRSVLLLVPEIALSTQLEALFQKRFGARLAVWHSGLPSSTRYHMWQEIHQGKRRVVLGVRSAVFMPLKNPGLIIVDEEHDSAYKQEDRLRYNARDVALMRASSLKIPIVLGSATPSLQTFLHGTSGNYGAVQLRERVLERPLPRMETVDMRRERGRQRILSHHLQKALVETVEAGEQALLFLNRRGFATFLLCNACGNVVQCSGCSVSMTYHQQAARLLCHYCGEKRPLPEKCSQCGAAPLLPFGFGTERVEEELRQILPHTATVRMDRDTVTHPGQIARLLNRMRSQEAQILIGTQMVAKGHDFPHITLVGVVNADTSLQLADFRAGETTVQLLIQVAGRAGRGTKPGRVILQTYNPAHYTMEAVRSMDYGNFCHTELESRQRLQYPPYTRLLKLLVTSHKEKATEEGAYRLAALCREMAHRFRGENRHVAVLGPSPAPLAKLKNRYRWHIFLKAWTSRDLQTFTQAVLEESGRDPVLRRVQLSTDRDPLVSL